MGFRKTRFSTIFELGTIAAAAAKQEEENTKEKLDFAFFLKVDEDKKTIEFSENFVSTKFIETEIFTSFFDAFPFFRFPLEIHEPAEVELIEKLNHGKELFEKSRHTRSLDEFNYILLNDRGSKIGVEARYYQGEAYFELEQYDEAIASYEKFLHYTTDQEKVEYIMYKICKCYFNL